MKEREDFAEVDNNFAMCASMSEEEIVVDIQSQHMIDENEIKQEQLLCHHLMKLLLQ